ncbi:hypothetical protein M407DRAFT_119349 [Tulasnella calospora MUT 4182]|uniref:Uncharacterized protein n=1 Tax=Tulasnella calospora MUT 4182 TaxID=1051891 RepID=A0A0C3Q1X5_9AGAM|nr:hypothetical protein M407DRAFT_119349 [Tulasnella calospora MUT 4182]
MYIVMGWPALKSVSTLSPRALATTQLKTTEAEGILKGGDIDSRCWSTKRLIITDGMQLYDTKTRFRQRCGYANV